MVNFRSSGSTSSQRGQGSSGRSYSTTAKSVGGNIASSSQQQGVYYSSTGEYLGTTGGGVQPSRLPGSVTQYGGVVNPATGETKPVTQVAEREQVLSKATATTTLGKPATPTSYRTVYGRTQTLARKPTPVVSLSSGFARKASESGVSVSQPSTPMVTLQGRTTRPEGVLTQSLTQPVERQYFYQKKTTTRKTI